MKRAQIALLCNSIRRTLALRAGNILDADAVADATLSIWHELAARLIPLIGARAVYAILNRSLQLASFSYSSLAHANGANSAVQLINLKKSIKACGSADASEASNTLLETYIELLAKLIGASLTVRLLDTISMLPSTKSEDAIRR